MLERGGRAVRALVVGCEGQDGRHLAQQLADDGVAVFGISQSGLHQPDGSVQGVVAIDDMAAVAKTIHEFNPDRIFYLAAYHHSSQEKEAKNPAIIRDSFAVNTFGLLNVLEAARCHVPEARLFYAASSRVFGIPDRSPQDESTPWAPICPYGISKAAGMGLCRMYRRDHGLFCAAGILYNHESPLRSPKFVSRKIVRSAVAIERGYREPLVLDNLDHQVDWGYAPEYTDAMRRILDLDEPNDFVVASGRLHSIGDFVETVFGYMGLEQ